MQEPDDVLPAPPYGDLDHSWEGNNLETGFMQMHLSNCIGDGTLHHSLVKGDAPLHRASAFVHQVGSGGTLNVSVEFPVLHGEGVQHHAV